MMKDKKVLAGGAVLFVALFWFVLKPMFFGPPAPPPHYTDKQIADAPRPTLQLEERVLNLKAAATSPNYVKTAIAIEFTDPKYTYMGLSGAALTTKNTELTTEMQPDLHRIWDVITSVVGNKTIDQVATSDGRDQLKAELIDALNKELTDRKVENVYFSSFVTQ